MDLIGSYVGLYLFAFILVKEYVFHIFDYLDCYEISLLCEQCTAIVFLT